MNKIRAETDSFSPPVSLAPMSGVTDAAFRRIARRFGAAQAASEMVAADEFVRGREEARLRAESCGAAPHVVQLAGCEPGWMGEAARLAAGAGADIIDINMGCPARRVINGWAGSALMRDLDLAARLVEAVRTAVPVPVTVKMRLGWDESSLNAADLARRAEALGASAVTVHGRTRAQFYKGEASWEAVAPVSEAVAIPVVVNGDVVDVASAASALRRSGAAGVMVGRAALGQPWLPGAIAAALAGRADPTPSPAGMAEAAVEHVEHLLLTMGRESGIRHARKHVAAYGGTATRLGSRHACGPARAAALTSDNPAVVIAYLRASFEDAGERRAA